MYLSFSGYDKYGQCPLSYWHSYVNKTVMPTPDNGVNALYGSIVGIGFEKFYVDKLWKHQDPTAVMLQRVDEFYTLAVKSQRGVVIDWGDEKANYHSREELMAEVVVAIPRGIEIIKRHRFLGPMADAEVKLDTSFRQHRIGGRADFIVKRTRPHGDLIILDGKGSKHREKYVKPTQLKLYAMLYHVKFGVIPDGIGFVFWRSEPHESVDWVAFDKHDLSNLREEVLMTMDRIEASTTRLTALSGRVKAFDETRQELFPAQAGFHCNLCSYVDVCEEGTKAVQTTKRKPKVILPGSGVRDLNLDDD